MKALRLLLIPLAMAFSCAVLAQSGEPERMRIHGSNVLGDRLVPSLVVGWLESIEYQQIRRRDIGPTRIEISAERDGEKLIVEIDKRGTASGYRGIVAGDAEIGMTARSPTAKEAEDAWQIGDLHAPDHEWVVALDGLAVVVGPDNPVAAMSVPQLRDVLAGKIRDWRELGGRPGPIRLHAIGKTGGLGAQLAAFGLGKRSTSAVISHRSQQQIIAAVRADSNAVGIVGLRLPRAGVRALAIRSGTQAFLPDTLTLRSEDYPLARRLHFHTGQLITALGRGFVLYAVSPAGQAVVDRSQFMSLAITPMQPARNDGPVEYQKFVRNAKRLPMALRFSTGLDLFDSRSRQDIDRLAFFVARPENAARRLVLIGFANPDPKSPYQAVSLSQERVDYVASELLKLDMKVVTVRGLGGQMTLVDSSQPGARYRNDRVEVWLR